MKQYKLLIKKITFLFYILFSTLVFLSCEREGEPDLSSFIGEKVRVFLDIDINKPVITRSEAERIPQEGIIVSFSEPAKTKSDGLEDIEYQINHLWLFQFGGEDNLLLDKKYISKSDLESGDVLEQSLIESSSSTIYIVANDNSIGASLETGDPISKYQDMTFQWDKYTLEDIRDNGLILSGSYSGVVAENQKLGIGLESVLHKLSTSISVNITDPAYSLDITSIQLRNIPYSARFYDDSPLPGLIAYYIWKYPDPINETLVRDLDKVNFSEGLSEDNNSHLWYLPENRRGRENLDSPKNKIITKFTYATLLELNGIYGSPGMGPRDIQFSIIPGLDNKNDANLIRNHHANMLIDIREIDEYTDKRIEIAEDPVNSRMPRLSYMSTSSNYLVVYGVVGSKLKISNPEGDKEESFTVNTQSRSYTIWDFESGDKLILIQTEPGKNPSLPVEIIAD